MIDSRTHSGNRRIRDFRENISLVAKRPSPKHVAAIATTIRQGTPIYLSVDPHCPSYLASEGAMKLLSHGFSPVPHVAVRMFADEAALDRFLTQLASVGVKRLFLIAGDVDYAPGTLENSLQLVQSGLLSRHGFDEIGIAGYPEGHPRLADDVIECSLAEKISAAEQNGIRVHIASQFCFQPRKIIEWVQSLRERGFDNPIRIGIPGPTNVPTLLAYATACGVNVSLTELQNGMNSEHEPIWTPEWLLGELLEAFSKRDPGNVGVIFFAFGGLARCASWITAWTAKSR